MRSLWVQVLLLFIYLFLVFFISRMLDLVLWYHHGIPSTQIVDPLLLSVHQLKHLLENRGVSYTGYVEKKELALLVKASAEVVHGEVEELSQSGGGEGDRERLATSPLPSRFTGGSHFYEEVEDTKDSVWLVQVVPHGAHQSEPLLDDYSWRVVCNQVAPFAIRTGIFDCKLDRRLCSSKGWHQPLLLLALPKGTRAKDRVILRTFTSTRPQPIVEWVRDQLSIRVKTIDNLTELKRDWLGEDLPEGNSTGTPSSVRDVKVLLLTHLLHPPLFLAALSIKFTGRIKFGMFSVKKQDSESLCKKLKLIDHEIPIYLVITPEQKVIYGKRRFEHFNFASMNVFLRAIQPEMNDVFLWSLVLVNMLVILQIFQVSVQLWWKHVASCLWTLVSYNLWLFSAWLALLATYRFSLVNYLAENSLVLVRLAGLTDVGSLLRSDWQFLSRHPYVLAVGFFLYGVVAAQLLRRHWLSEVEIERESDRPWWEVLPVDSYWINCFFRPMATLSRPLPPSELELEESIEMLIERLAVPNLWLQPVIPSEYIKDLPIWRFRGWDPAISKSEAKWTFNNPRDDSPETIQQIMDGKEPRREPCRDCSTTSCQCENENVKYRHIQSNLCSQRNMCVCGKESDATPYKCCANITSSTHCSDRLCSCKCGCRYSNRNCSHSSHISNHYSENVRTPQTCPCNQSRDVDVTRVSSASPSDRTVGREPECAKDSSSVSEDSGDECSLAPTGMLPVSDCAVCLESYTWNVQLCGLPCGHSYHQGCIMLWLQRDNHHCPVCRWPAYKAKHLHRE